MAIPVEDIAAVRAATDIGALIGEYVPLKRVGTRLQGLCPFHQEKSPSFSVNPGEGFYHCFGCGVSGDAISFIRAMDALDFAEAVERLGARAGISVRNDAPGGASRVDRDRRQALYGAMEAAVDFYHRRLLEAADAGPARQYLRSRGYDGATVREFKIGWAPGGWDELCRKLAPPAKPLIDTGLAFENSRGRLQDFFRGRVIFPIFDTSGRPIALGARSLPDDQSGGPKYRNSPETAIYSKRRTLYGLNWAKQDLVQAGEVVVCEGYTDVIGFFTAGVPRAVATCGTALTDEHMRVLGHYAKRLVLAFDADAAGQSAAARIYEGERKHGLEIAVAALPAGTDPAELARSDPGGLAKAVSDAKPFLEFRIDRALAAGDMRTVEGRVRAAGAALRAIAEHPDDLVRDQYTMLVADRTRLTLAQAREQMDRARAGGAAIGGDPAEARADAATLATRPTGLGGNVRGGAEKNALYLAVHRPEEMAAHLDEVLFKDPVHKEAYRVLCSSSSLHDAVDAADPDVAELLGELAVLDWDVSVDATVAELALGAADRLLAELKVDARNAQAAGEPERIASIDADVNFLQGTVHDLQRQVGDAYPGTEAGDRLVAWLAERCGEGS